MGDYQSQYTQVQSIKDQWSQCTQIQTSEDQYTQTHNTQDEDLTDNECQLLAKKI